MHEPPEDEQFPDSNERSELEDALSQFRQEFSIEDSFESEETERMQKVKDALDPLEKLTEVDSQESKQKMRDAAEILEQNADLDPELRLVLGNIKFHLRDFDSAERYFREHIQEFPEASDAWYNLGRTLLAKKLPQEALDALETSYGLSPDFDTLFQKGHAFRELGKLEDAIDAFSKYTEYEPEDFYGYIALGQAYSLAGESELAQKTFESARLFAQGDPKKLFDLGVWHRHIDQVQTAQNIFLEALDLFDCPIDARLLLAETQIRLDNYEGAEQNALMFCRERPKDPNGWYILGVAEMLKKTYPLAEAAFKEFCYLDGDNTDVRHYLALCKIAQHKYNEAGTTILENGRREQNEWLMRAGSSLSNNDLKNAEYCLERCVRDDTTNLNHWNYLLNIKLARGKRIERLIEKMESKYSISTSSVLIVL